MRNACLLLAVVAALAQPAAAHAKEPAARLEPVSGSGVQRVILTARAAERLGIETGRITEQPVVRRQMVGGLVMPGLDRQNEPNRGGGFAGFGQVSAPPEPESAAAGASAPAAGEMRVLVTLSKPEWERVAKDKPARLLPLATRGTPSSEVLARLSEMPPQEDARRSMLRLYYVLQGSDHGLTPNRRVRVELQLSGSDESRKVAPYPAVYYDAKGLPWVYVSKQALVFERQPIVIERVAGDLAVLSEGPAAGTVVVTVGAALLYGVEVFGK